MSRLEGVERHRSTLEVYATPGERYEREPLPYDMADPLDLAVWVGVVVYREMCGAGARNTEEMSKGRPTIWEVEQDLRDLASNSRAVLGRLPGERLASREATAAGLAVLGALFPAEAPEGGSDAERAVPEARVPAELWNDSSAWLAHRRDSEHRDEDGPSPSGASGERTAGPDRPGMDPAGPDSEEETELAYGENREQLRPAQLGRPLVTVVYMARLALGDTITQSEAARRLGVSPARVNAFLGGGRLSRVRVGRTVLLLEDEVSMGLRDLRRRASDLQGPSTNRPTERAAGARREQSPGFRTGQVGKQGEEPVAVPGPAGTAGVGQESFPQFHSG